jgi:sulfoxide reductase heme-binding subunit YedZ
MAQHFFWITSRAAGFAALILASLAVALGLLMSTKLLRGRGLDLRSTHEALSLATLAALVVHAVSLLGDKYLHPSLADISIPFVSGYKSVWMTIGIVAGWGLMLLGLGYYARRAIGAARWRKLHRFTALMWAGGLIHSIGMGTDAGQLWFVAMVALVAIPAAALLIVRFVPRGSEARRVGRGSEARRAARGSEAGRLGRGSDARRAARGSEAGRVAGDVAGGVGHRLRPAGPALRERDRVEAPARDDHESVTGVRVHGDPLPRPWRAPAFETGRVER